ncbi:phosphotransferase [Streptomyces azureus]|uniref:Phosphotransferase n=1 Tax=Streptomyces azureus TaxID=146537 RepID=A0A0K8PI46_STRAJ|nr:phosphotransferase [Streptomyces azureus]
MLSKSVLHHSTPAVATPAAFAPLLGAFPLATGVDLPKHTWRPSASASLHCSTADFDERADSGVPAEPWWSLRSLLGVGRLVEHGFDPSAPCCEVDVLRARL